MKDLFKETLNLSAKLRSEYPDSLGKNISEYNKTIKKFWNGELPDLISAIYCLVSGTRSNIKEQALMDFVPGYRLIHIDELTYAYQDLYNMTKKSLCFPFLANYSSDYLCVLQKKVYGFTHDDNSLFLMHNSETDFLLTVCEFYNKHVYLLDHDGYLDYDPEKESTIGMQMNPHIPYWE